MDEKVIAKTVFLSYVNFAEQLNVDTTIFIEKAKIQLNSDVIPFEQFAGFLRYIIQKSKNEHIGLYFGIQSNMAALGIVGQLIQTSKTIEEGITQALFGFNLISNVITLKLDKTKTHCCFYFEIEDTVKAQFPIACTQLLVGSMMFVYKEIYFLTLKKYQPVWMECAFPILNQLLYERMFKCPVKADQNKNCIAFDLNILQEEIVYADYELFVHLETVTCKRLTVQQENKTTVSDKVKTIVCKLLDPSFPKLEIVAAHLNISERVLQRKLKAENTSYSKILSTLKKSMAKEYLATDNSIKEISYLLGYSEPSIFINAFKNWYGESPSKFRKKRI